MSTRVTVARDSLVQHTRTAVLMVVVLTVLLGIVYPLIMTGLSQVFFPSQANGSLIRDSAGGSNLGPTNQKLIDAATDRATAYRAENGLAADALVPVDAVTASASGLDPDISPANALIQAGRVARARNLSEEQVRSLVNQYTEGRTLGV